MTEDMDKRIEQYVKLRDCLKVVDEAHELKRKPLVQLMDEVSGQLRAFMEANNLENLKTEHGTCYTTTRHSASLADPDIFMKHVIATSNWELLDRRANATAVQAYVKEKGALPPGVNLNAIQTVGVRRASGK
jgi:hypothetical protein